MSQYGFQQNMSTCQALIYIIDGITLSLDAKQYAIGVYIDLKRHLTNRLVGIKWLTRLFNVCFTKGDIPTEWRRGVIVPMWKGKETSMIQRAKPERISWDLGKGEERMKEKGIRHRANRTCICSHEMDGGWRTRG